MTTELADAIEEVKRSRQAFHDAKWRCYDTRQAVIAAEQREQDIRDLLSKLAVHKPGDDK